MADKNENEFDFDDLEDGAVDDANTNFDDFSDIEEKQETPESNDANTSFETEEEFDEDSTFNAGGIAEKKPFYKTQNGIIAIVCGVGMAGWFALAPPVGVNENGLSDNQQQVANMAELAASRTSPNPDGAVTPTFDSPAAPASVVPADAAPTFNAQSTPALDNSVAPEAVAPATVDTQAPVNAFDAPSQPVSLDTQNKLNEINSQLAVFGAQFGFVVDEIKAIKAQQAIIEGDIKKAYSTASGDDKLLKEVQKLTKKVSSLSRKVYHLTKKQKSTPPKRFVLDKFSMTGLSDGKAWVKSAVTGSTFRVVVGESISSLGKAVSISTKEIVFSKGGVILPAK